MPRGRVGGCEAGGRALMGTCGLLFWLQILQDTSALGVLMQEKLSVSALLE